MLYWNLYITYHFQIYVILPHPIVSTSARLLPCHECSEHCTTCHIASFSLSHLSSKLVKVVYIVCHFEICIYYEMTIIMAIKSWCVSHTFNFCAECISNRAFPQSCKNQYVWTMLLHLYIQHDSYSTCP